MNLKGTVARAIRSAHNRAQPWAMLARGALARGLRPGIIRGGQALALGASVRLSIYGELVLGSGVQFADGCALEVGPYARMIIGDRVFVGRHTVIVAQKLIEIGEQSLIAEHCSIRDQDHHLDASERAAEREAVTSPIVLQPRVWVGAGTRLLRGANIGEGSVIGANSVVRGPIPAGVVAVGAPARVIRSLDRP